jgi:hypothetical protein
MLKGDAAPRHQRLPMFCFLFCFGKANEQRRFWLLRPWLFTVLSSFYVLLSCLNYRVYPVAFYRFVWITEFILRFFSLSFGDFILLKLLNQWLRVLSHLGSLWQCRENAIY